MTAPISRKGPSLGPDAARATETRPGQAPTGRPSSEGPAAPAGLARRALQPQGGVAGRTRTAALPQQPAVARQAASPAGSPVAAQRKAAASAADGTLLLAALQQDLSVPGHQEAAHGVAILHGQAALAGLDRSLPSDLAGARRGAEQAALAFGALHGGDRMPDAAVEALLDGAASRRAEAMVGAMAPLPPLPFEPIDERAIVPDAMVHGMNALEPASGTALRERARSPAGGHHDTGQRRQCAGRADRPGGRGPWRARGGRPPRGRRAGAAPAGVHPGGAGPGRAGRGRLVRGRPRAGRPGEGDGNRRGRAALHGGTRGRGCGGARSQPRAGPAGAACRAIGGPLFRHDGGTGPVRVGSPVRCRRPAPWRKMRRSAGPCSAVAVPSASRSVRSRPSHR